MTRSRCYLGLEDGTVFAGEHFGAEGTTTGEVVFNTAMSGYQEILTDPSYCGQIVTMTMPQIGNYGVNKEDVESLPRHEESKAGALRSTEALRSPDALRSTEALRSQDGLRSPLYLSGFVVKELARRHSNYRATGDLHDYLRGAGVIGLSGVDTRSLTRRLRDRGSLRGVISTEFNDPAALVEMARAVVQMEGLNLVEKVQPTDELRYEPDVGQTGDRKAPLRSTLHHIVAIDCGIKQNILRELNAAGCSVRVVPPTASVETILQSNPRGLLIGNGPGDPATVTDVIDTLRQLIGRLPIFGICLGHQLLALALGAKTYKLKFGHHGANHPVLNVDNGRVEITSQNHGFAVDIAGLEAVGGRVTHVNLYDRSLEGFAHADKRLFAVQYHPEAAPGPHDSRYLFEQFVAMLHS